jgi:two-component system NtrC family sensor kinase
MRRRLAAKLIISLTFIVVVVEGLVAYFNARSQEQQLLDSMVLGVDQLSRSITSATWHAMLADHRTSAYEIMQTIAAKQGIERIRIFNKEGKVTFSTAPEEVRSQVDKRAEACFLCHAEAQPLVRVDVPSRARIFRIPGGERTLGMVTPIYNEPACSTAECHAHPVEQNVLGVLDVGLSLATVDREVAGMRLRMVAVVAVEIALIAVFAVFFIRRFVDSPIGELVEGTKAVSNMELDRPVHVRARDELGELANSFNAMREHLRSTVEELGDLNRSLEEKVQERTEELRAAQEKLAQSERLASLGQLAATVAHEINNPVSGLLNLSMLMQRILKDDGIPPKRVAEFRGYLGQAVSETARVGRIVTDLLSFSRQSRPVAGRADLNALVNSTVALVGHRLERAGVTVALSLAPELPPVKGDGGQIQQVITNLVVNGLEAMPDGGKLVIRTRAEVSRPVVVMEVEDSGIGIPAAHLPRIFDPFFTTKENGRGVGLGLAVVYGLVQSHGGEIDVRSVPGQGTTFRVILPACQDDGPTTEPVSVGGRPDLARGKTE